MNRHESEEEVSLTDVPKEGCPCCKRIETTIVDHFTVHRREYEENFIMGGWILLFMCFVLVSGILLYFTMQAFFAHLYNS